MAHITLRQGNVTAKLSEVSYLPDEGFEEDNTWHVSEASISAESDTKLVDGPATIQHAGSDFPVVVTVFGEEEDENSFPIDIGSTADLSKLAQALGLLGLEDVNISM